MAVEPHVGHDCTLVRLELLPDFDAQAGITRGELDRLPRRLLELGFTRARGQFRPGDLAATLLDRSIKCRVRDCRVVAAGMGVVVGSQWVWWWERASLPLMPLGRGTLHPISVTTTAFLSSVKGRGDAGVGSGKGR